MTDEPGSMPLCFATADEIADELERRYKGVVMALWCPREGTLMMKRGEMVIAIGLHWELGRFIRSAYDRVPDVTPGLGD